MPGSGSQVVNGESATSGVALVSASSKADLPTLGGPMRTTWPAPSRPMLNAEARRAPPL